MSQNNKVLLTSEKQESLSSSIPLAHTSESNESSISNETIFKSNRKTNYSRWNLGAVWDFFKWEKPIHQNII